MLIKQTSGSEGEEKISGRQCWAVVPNMREKGREGAHQRASEPNDRTLPPPNPCSIYREGWEDCFLFLLVGLGGLFSFFIGGVRYYTYILKPL
jgi:hypothetical protein